MGFLRLYLALCVVNAHTGNMFPWLAPRGRHAVEIFFIISGFYMAMVLSGRYHNKRDFYESRWLRIAVPYYIHLVAIVLLSVVSGLFFSQWLALSAFADDPLARNGLAGILVASATNLTIFGQDLVLFLKDNAGGGLRFTPDFNSHADPLYRYLVIPQCWSVAIELVFYLAAPFLNKLRTPALAALLIASVAARFLAYGPAGLDHDPWVYRFLPFELAWFVAGMLGWRLLAWIDARVGRCAPPGPAAYAAICLAVVIIGAALRWVYQFLGPHIGEAASGFVIIASSVPFILVAFHLTRSHTADRLIGELSYPVYLNHLFFIVALRAIPALEPFAAWFGVLTGILSVACAWIFWQGFLAKFEVRRHRNFGLAPLPSQ